ncbi:MAG: hypothetical protein HY906_23465 [Deltaproteobacteria bacterium]|nr:hypothetical protein [Deltaproteobacteria bacterium]
MRRCTVGQCPTWWLAFLVPWCSACGGIDFGPPPAWVEPDSPPRTSRSLDGTWSFTPEGYAARDVPVPCFWEAVPTPNYDLACPGYLDGTPDEGLTQTEGDNWPKRTIHRGTYRLDLDLGQPAAVTRLWFEALHHAATVRLNGTEVGTHLGAYRKIGFDLTPAARPGANGLEVEVTDGSALLGEDGITDWPVGAYSHTDITGIYRSVTLESLPAVYVDRTFVVPSVRRLDVTLEHTLGNSTGEDVGVWVISRAVDAEGQVALETAPQPVKVPAHGSARVVVVQPWADAAPWSPASPTRYTLRTLLVDPEGRAVDLSEERFGFREVWIENGDFVLNGRRLNLMGDSVDDPGLRARYWGPRYFACDRARETLQRMKDLNFNVVRFHQSPPEDCVFDLCDELGLMIISESAIYARLDILPPVNNDETYVANARTWLRDWVVRQRNHPAIVMWSVENEMEIYFHALTDLQLLSLRDPVWETDAIVRPDGITTTPRPVNWDGDSPFMYRDGLDVETINWHYPHGDWDTTEPAKEYWDDPLDFYARYLVADPPCGVGETTNHRPKSLPDGMSYTQIKAMQGIAVRAMRILGYDDMRPYKLNWAWHFFYADGSEHPFAPYYHALYSQEEKDLLTRNLRESYHPIAVFDRESTRLRPNLDGTVGPVALPAETDVARTLVLLNDSFLPGVPQQVTWSVVDEDAGAALAGDTFELALALGSREERAIAFTAPAAAAYLGDSRFDMEMAVRAGVAGWGAAWGLHGRRELLAAGAARCFDSPAEVGTALLAAGEPAPGALRPVRAGDGRAR